jgi:hypothetical protein
MPENKAGLNIYNQEVEPMTVDKLISLFPQKKRTINQKTVDLINQSLDDPRFDGYSFENTLVEFRKVMDRRSGSLIDYIRAIKFVAYLDSGMSDAQAYRMAFADRELVRKAIGKSATSNEAMAVTSSAHRYKKTPMVQDILTLGDVPMGLLHQTTLYQAVGVLADEMINAGTSKDRIAAAAVLVKELKTNETNKFTLEVGLSQDAQSQIETTNKTMYEIAQMQKKMYEGGLSIQDVQQIHTLKKDKQVIDAEIE